ncbi:MAG: polysaccharide deacetylase family protein [Candidatus Omnitrophota bacterium]
MRFRKRVIAGIGLFGIAVAVLANIFFASIWRLPILMYHSVGYTTDTSDRMTISPEIFEKQMKYLRDKRYNVVPIEEAVSLMNGEKRPPANTVAITFDDGYKNNYNYAYPILKKYGIPAAIFVVTGLVGEENFMDWDEVKEMSDSGIVDIESHTLSHKWLTGLGDADLERELTVSKDVLEARLGKKIRFLCYPMGGYDERVKQAARAAGYEAAFATKPKSISKSYDQYEIKRVRISPTANNLFVFRIKLSGYHAFFRVVQNDYKNVPYILWKK